METSKSPEVAPTEVRPPTGRRTFPAAFKLEVLAAADKCSKRGQIGALLRRHGLTSTHLTEWRLAREQGLLSPQTPRRGPVPLAQDPLQARLRELERALARMTLRAERAEMLIELQKKVGELLSASSVIRSDVP